MSIEEYHVPSMAAIEALDNLSPQTQTLMKVLSLLDPNRITEELLTTGASEVKLPGYPTEEHDYVAACEELIQASLVVRNAATNELRVDRPVQKITRDKMGTDEMYAVYAAVMDMISIVWPWVSGIDPTRNQAWRVPIAERFTPHICHIEDLLGDDIRNAKFEGTETSGHVFSSYAWYTAERGNPTQSAKFAHLVVQILEKALKRGATDDERATHWLGEAHHSLSFAACLTGDSDGIHDAKIWLQILQRRIERYSNAADSLALATAYNQMGICLVNADNLQDAVENFQRSIATFQSVDEAPPFSGTFPAISLSNLLSLQGRWDEAQKVLAPTLEEHVDALGIDDVTTTESGHIWRAMGIILHGKGNYDEALVYHKRAVRNIRATLGDEHYFTADCLYALAQSLTQVGEWEDASEHLDKAITAFLADSHREAQAARALWKKVCLLGELGHDASSKEFFGKAMELRHIIAPNDKRELEVLQDKDWTNLIMYWSR